MPDTSHGMNSFFFITENNFQDSCWHLRSVSDTLCFIWILLFLEFNCLILKRKEKKRTESHPRDSMYKLSEYFSALFNLQFDYINYS